MEQNEILLNVDLETSPVEFLNKSMCKYLNVPDGDFQFLSLDPIIYKIVAASINGALELCNLGFNKMVEKGQVVLTEEYYKSLEKAKANWTKIKAK